MTISVVQGRQLSTVELNWKEVFYTNCGMVSASNVDQELGWCQGELKWVNEGGCMLVRARDPIYRMNHLKGRRIVLTKSLNTIRNDWWRITEHMGIDTILRLNDMTVDDVDIVGFPYADDGYDNPKMLEPLNNPTELYSGLLNHKKNLACVEIAKTFMVQHGYIKRDFDVQRWAAPEFLERAAKEPIDGTWQKKTDAMLPTGTTIHLG